MQKRKNFTKQLCVNAVLIALFYVLDMFSLRIGNSMEITFDGLPIIIAAIFFGPVSGMAVGLVGAFLSQLVAYGLGPTTVLWIIPAGLRGIIVGGFAIALKKRNILHEVKLSDIFKAPKTGGSSFYKWLYDTVIWKLKLYPILTAVIIFSSLVITTVNTAVMYADAKIYGYYTKEGVFGLLLWRIASSIITAIIYSIIVPLLLKPLNKAIKR